MEGVRCPRIVGRADEVAALREAVDAVRRGMGSTHFLVGEAGVGKSRLAADVAGHADEQGLLVLRGRAVDGPHPVTFRPFTEALLAAMRDGSLPNETELDGFGPALGRLLPGRTDPATDVSLIAVAEGVLRLLRLLGRARGCLLVLEDLHWTDPETLAVLEYLADHCAGERLAVVATVRAELPCQALELASALDARRSARRIHVGRLLDDDVYRMVRACLGTEELPAEVDTFVGGRADGVPFFVEELLAGLVNSGALVRDGTTWHAVSRLVPAVPLTVTASIQRRLAEPGLPAVLAAAAVLGRRFDWSLLAEITGKPEAEVLQALRASIDGQLLDTDDDGFRFRHALTRDAVLDSLLPPERARLAGSAAEALHAKHPELEGDRCELAASLHEAAGDDHRAAELLIAAADRASRRGALASAEALLVRARELGGAADAALLHVLALGGQTARVFELGESMLRLSTQDNLVVRLAMARAAVSAGLWKQAAEHVEHARGLGDSAATTVLAAQVAMGQGRETDAAALAETALADTEAPEVECEALEILGRVVRAGDLGAAEERFERARAVAERAGLAVWRMRALHELGTIDLLDNGRADRLEAARAAAAETGALATLAVIDLHLGDLYSLIGRDEEGSAALTRCVALSRQLGLATLPVALCHLAGNHVRLGRRAESEGLLAEAAGIAPDDPDVLAGIPITRGMSAMLQADLDGAREQLDLAAAQAEIHPIPFPMRGLWALLRTVQGLDGAAARETVRTSGALGVRAALVGLRYAEAVAHGQEGRAQDAERLFAEADRIMAGYASMDEFHYLNRLPAAQAALRDGWGAGVDWMRECLTWCEDNGREQLAAYCRKLLKDAGVPVRRRRDATGIPAELRELGVTQREMEVLALVAEGLSNAEIGERLFISSRTVEKHVEKLLTRTGTRTRGQLAVKAERLRLGRMG